MSKLDLIAKEVHSNSYFQEEYEKIIRDYDALLPVQQTEKSIYNIVAEKMINRKKDCIVTEEIRSFYAKIAMVLLDEKLGKLPTEKEVMNKLHQEQVRILKNKKTF